MIKKARTAAGMSQTDLAKRIGVSKQTLYKYENGVVTNIPSDKIEAISDIVHVSPAYLMGWEEPDTPDLTLSPDEEKHIRNYRALDEADRIKVDGYMDGILDGEKYKRGRSGIA